jgi:hypothetical protein
MTTPESSESTLRFRAGSASRTIPVSAGEGREKSPKSLLPCTGLLKGVPSAFSLASRSIVALGPNTSEVEVMKAGSARISGLMACSNVKCGGYMMKWMCTSVFDVSTGAFDVSTSVFKSSVSVFKASTLVLDTLWLQGSFGQTCHVPMEHDSFGEAAMNEAEIDKS